MTINIRRRQFLEFFKIISSSVCFHTLSHEGRRQAAKKKIQLMFNLSQASNFSIMFDASAAVHLLSIFFLSPFISSSTCLHVALLDFPGRFVVAHSTVISCNHPLSFIPFLFLLLSHCHCHCIYMCYTVVI